MIRHSSLFVIAIVAIAPLIPRPARAQSPTNVQRCSPRPAAGAATSNVQLVSPNGKQYYLDEVRFEGDTKLTRSELDETAVESLRAARSTRPDRYDEIADLARAHWQDRGYFRVEITASLEQLSHDPTSERYGVVFHVTAGRKYRAGEIQLGRNGGGQTAFSVDELRKLIPLRQGDIFNTAKLKDGFDALKKPYRESGYIDMTSLPQFDIDDDAAVINMTILIDEGPQFRIGRVEIFGLDPAMQSDLRAVVPVGEVFKYDRILNFIDNNRSMLPSDAGPDDIEIRRDQKHATASLTFNFQACTQSTN